MGMNFEQLQKLALDCGFTHVCRLNMDAIQLHALRKLYLSG